MDYCCKKRWPVSNINVLLQSAESGFSDGFCVHARQRTSQSRCNSGTNIVFPRCAWKTNTHMRTQSNFRLMAIMLAI